jgi:hypothetical protein
MCFQIIVISVLPELIVLSHDSLDSKESNDADEQENELQSIYLKPAAQLLKSKFKLKVRTVFLAIALITSAWIFLLVLFWRKSYIEAFIFSAIFLSSWELNYHARWIAPDCVMMQFAFLLLLFMFLHFHKKKGASAYLTFSAIAVGLSQARNIREESSFYFLSWPYYQRVGCRRFLVFLS